MPIKPQTHRTGLASRTALQHERRDTRRSPRQRGYDRPWEKLRLQHLAIEPLCRMCRADGRIVAARVVDHIERIEVAPHRRLDPSNLQSLCKHHHDSTKQREERGRVMRVTPEGLPIR